MSGENKTPAEGSKLVAALVKAQAKIGSAKKDTDNAFFKSKYADLASVVEAIKPAAEEFGLAYFQRFHDHEGGIAIETIILHESGERLSNGVLSVPAVKQDPQGYGSAITYARRYSLQTAFGVAPEEDDGNAAADAKKKAEVKPPLQAKSTANKPDLNERESINPAKDQEFKVNDWCGMMDIASKGDVVEFSTWWAANKPDIIKECGEDGAKKVHAAYASTVKLMAQKAVEK